MKVKDLMTRQPSTITVDATCGEAATLMKQEDCGSLPVLRNGELVGIVTDRDIVIRCVAAGKEPRTTKVSEVMSADPVTIRMDQDVVDAERVMAERQIRRLPVCDDGKLAGILVIGQLARVEQDDEKVGETLKEISEPKSGRGTHARG